MIFNLMRNAMKIYTLINKMVGLSKNDVKEICQDKCYIKITINNLVIFCDTPRINVMKVIENIF